MRNENRRDADGALNFADSATQLLTNLRIESAEGLIEQQHAWLVRQCARYGNALLLAT
jgi:hypothetical protein